MKTPIPQLTAPLVSRSLKAVGLILIVATLVNMAILLFPFQPTDRPWLIAAADQITNRGITPLMGIVFVFLGDWVDGVAGAPTEPRSAWQDLRFWASLLASLLGLILLLIAFLYPNFNYNATVEQVNQEISQVQAQENNRISAGLEQRKALLDRLIAANDEQLNQAVQGGAIRQEDADRIRQFKQNPNSLQTFLQQSEAEARQQLETQIGERRDRALAAAKNASLKSGLSTGISSFLLAIGYSIVGWSGLRSIGTGRSI